MFEFLLVVRLYAGGPVVVFPVKDCTEGTAWIVEARAWSTRSHLDPVRGPLYACYPMQSPYVLRMSRDE